MCRKSLAIGGLILVALVFAWSLSGKGSDNRTNLDVPKWEYKVVVNWQLLKQGAKQPKATPKQSDAGDPGDPFEAIKEPQALSMAYNLSDYGAEGWELVAVSHDGFYILKRQAKR